jgi:hypothetical protein
MYDWFTCAVKYAMCTSALPEAGHLTNEIGRMRLSFLRRARRTLAYETGCIALFYHGHPKSMTMQAKSVDVVVLMG